MTAGETLNPGAIDDVTTDDGGYVTVHLVQSWEWDGSDHLLLLLQEKLFNYLAFIADGELARMQSGQPARWRVAVNCRSAPDARTQELLRAAADEFTKLGGSLLVRQPSPEGR
ncbi:MAG: hypothetical protein QOD38_1646 [Acidimicrobiaceae bacterium]